MNHIVIDMLNNERSAFREKAKTVCEKIAVEFMNKYGTDTIHFDFRESNAPSPICNGFDDGLHDCFITDATFDSNGTLMSMELYDYYDQDFYSGDVDTCLDFDWVDLAEYIQTQIDNGQYIDDEYPDED